MLIVCFIFQEFKTLMSQCSESKQRLENAIRSNQQLVQKEKDESNAKPSLNQPPSIKLKTDFSNFS